MKTLWTDGSASPNPGPGGWAVLEVQDGAARPVALGREADTTNIRMEGTALIAAMEYAGDEGCEIHTDSELWVNILTKWAPGWRRRDWHKSSAKKRVLDDGTVEWRGGEIANLDLVVKLDELYRKYPVELVWVRGHVGTEFNELADKWANKARKGATLDMAR